MMPHEGIDPHVLRAWRTYTLGWLYTAQDAVAITAQDAMRGYDKQRIWIWTNESEETWTNKSESEQNSEQRSLNKPIWTNKWPEQTNLNKPTWQPEQHKLPTESEETNLKKWLNNTWNKSRGWLHICASWRMVHLGASPLESVSLQVWH